MKITKSNLQAVVDRINTVTKSPMTSYTKDAKGKYTANIGNYHIDSAYGGNKLVQMTNGNGGIKDITYGFVSKSELYSLMHAFLAGYETKNT